MDLERLSREELVRELRSILDGDPEAPASREEGRASGRVRVVLPQRAERLEHASLSLERALKQERLTLSSGLAQAIADQARLIVEANCAALALANEEDEPLWTWSSCLDAEHASAVRRHAGPRHVHREVSRTGRSVLVRGTDALVADDAPGGPVGIRSLLGVPIVGDTGPGGTLVLCDKRAGGDFSDDDRDILEMLAEHAAIAMDLARLGQQIRGETEARDTLLAVVAHDIRSPLQAIQLSARLILRDLGARGQGHRHIGNILRSVDRMQHLAEDLLEAALIHAGKFVIEAHPEEVQPIIDDCLDSCASAASAASVKLCADVAGGLPPVSGDRARLLQVTSNLVGNAIKLSKPGSTVGIRASATKDAVEFAVSDEGPGIPPDELAHVFEKFWRAKDPARRGFGLGLFVARGIVEALGGRMWVDSRPGAGTTFHFTVPVVRH